MHCAYCEQSVFELRRRTLRNGSVQFVQQCVTCGRAGSNPLPRSQVQNASKLHDWDDSLNERWERARLQDHTSKRETEHALWLQEHTMYLRSQAWKVRRYAVLKRSKGLCEGCGSAAATQVHHLSYEHWKEEFLWELVAVCDDCHERAHADPRGNS